MKSDKIVMVVFGLIGILALGGSGYWIYSQAQFVQASVSATGTVTRLERRGFNYKGGTRYFYYPEVEFKTTTGETVRFVSETGKDPADYREWDTVEVLYSPQNPGSAEIKSFRSLWLGPTIFAVVGVVFGGVFAYMVFSSARRRRQL
jgi:hypothetical protein